MVVAGGLRGDSTDRANSSIPAATSWCCTNRWETGIGEIGALVNLTYSQQRFYNATRFNSTNITNSSPASRDLANPRQDHSLSLLGRPVRSRGQALGCRRATFALQSKPNSDLEFYAEGYFQGYRANNFLDLFENNLRDMDPTLTNVVLVDGTNFVKSMTKSGGLRQQAFRSTHEADTDSYQVACSGAIWHTGKATLSTDFAYTSSIFNFFEHSLDSALASPQTVDVDFISTGGASFGLPNFNINDQSQYIWRGYFEGRIRAAGTGISVARRPRPRNQPAAGARAAEGRLPHHEPRNRCVLGNRYANTGSARGAAGQSRHRRL
ncbi:hypothetical protein AB5I41_27655 [Sphingomonas sp. MMS24-JH45]